MTVFARRRATQGVLAKVFPEFNLPVLIINGDTKMKSSFGKTGGLKVRNAILNDLKSRPGFNIAILSPFVAGIGLTIVEVCFALTNGSESCKFPSDALFLHLMRDLHESVFEVRLLTVRHDCNAKVAKERIKQVPRDHRVGCVAVSRKNRHQIIMALKLIMADDTTPLQQLGVERWICKLSNGAPHCRPLWGPNAKKWLTWYLAKEGAECLFLGTDSRGYVRLAVADANLYKRLTTPHADCYCPKCERPYSIVDLPDHGLCDTERHPIKCI